MAIAGNTSSMEILLAVAARAFEPRRAMSVFPADHQGLMKTPLIALTRTLGHRVTIEAARMLQHLSDLAEQSERARMLVGDIGETVGTAQGGGSLQSRRLSKRGRRCDQAAARGHCGASQKARLHQPTPFTIGSELGRSRPRRANALATAGPIGGTPGSPTPDGASVDGTIRISTAGISLIRKDL